MAHFFSFFSDKDQNLAVAGFFGGAAISFITLWLSIRFKRDDKKLMLLSLIAFVSFSYLAVYSFIKSFDLPTIAPAGGKNPKQQPEINPTSKPAGPPVVLPPSTVSDIDLRPRIFIGTLPPSGSPAISYTITNWSYSRSAENIWIYAFMIDGGYLTKVNQRHIEYLAAGAWKKISPFSSPSSSGDVALCISYFDDSKHVTELFYFKDENEYMRYPPLREMTTSHDKDKFVNGESCETEDDKAYKRLRQ